MTTEKDLRRWIDELGQIIGNDRLRNAEVDTIDQVASHLLDELDRGDYDEASRDL